MEIAALRPYFRGNPVHLMELISRHRGWIKSDLIGLLAPLSRHTLFGDSQRVRETWPGSQAHLAGRFELTCHLPDHVIPVFTDHGEGCVVPMTCVPSEEWDASDACARFTASGNPSPMAGLVEILKCIERTWQRTSQSPLPLRWRRAFTIGIGIPVHVGDVEGTSMELPIVLMILREVGRSFQGVLPWGSGPVFSSGPIDNDRFGRTREVTAKLRGFSREFGHERPAILTRDQRDEVKATDPRLLESLKFEVVNTLDELLALPALESGLRALGGPPARAEIDHLARLMARFQRGARFSDALQIGDYLRPHAGSAPYRVRIAGAVGHLLLHQGLIHEASRFLEEARETIASGSRLGIDVRAHFAAIQGIHFLDRGEPELALDALKIKGLNQCSHLSRIEVLGTRSQALRAIEQFPEAAKAAVRAVQLAKKGLASEAGRDLNYVAHALIKQAFSASGEMRTKLLSLASSRINESRQDWAPIDPARLAAHLLFCRHYAAEIERCAGRPSQPGIRPADIHAEWRHPWLFELLSCSRNPANALTDRQRWARLLVEDSAIVKQGDFRGRRVIFELFHLVYRVWYAAITEDDMPSQIRALREWCEVLAANGAPGWLRILSSNLGTPPKSPAAWPKIASELCSAIYFH